MTTDNNTYQQDVMPSETCDGIRPGFCARAANGQPRCQKRTCWIVEDDE